MSSKNNATEAGAAGDRRMSGRVSIGARLAIAYTLSAFLMLAMTTSMLYSILIKGLEWDERQLVFNKVKMFEATLRRNGDNMDILENEVNLEGGDRKSVV